MRAVSLTSRIFTAQRDGLIGLGVPANRISIDHGADDLEVHQALLGEH
jgi:hypothetical protein